MKFTWSSSLEKNQHAAAFGAEGLALGAAVEVECIAYIPN